MTLDLVPWFWNHVENLGDVIIYPVLVVARTGSRLLSSASGHGTVAKRTVGKGRDFFLLPIFPRAILPRTFSFVTCRLGSLMAFLSDRSQSFKTPPNLYC